MTSYPISFIRPIMLSALGLLSSMAVLMTSVALPMETSGAPLTKPTWQTATVLDVTAAKYTSGASSVPRQSERYTLSTQAG
ncbi:MAG: hypothetical protein VKK59_04885, partial [Vampirovibrionales bacterium]|nr:hypothetical protein [Vampirovibrionales bacterium]